jgi:hypothetical protein
MVKEQQMHTSKLTLLALILLFASFPINTYKAITYELNKGRLGDHLMTLIRACYAAEVIQKLIKQNTRENDTPDKLEFLYKEFEFSDKLAIHSLAKKYKPGKHGLLPAQKIAKLDDIRPDKANEHTIYVTDLKFQISLLESFNTLHSYIFNNKRFYNKLKKLFQPIVPISLIDLPDNITSVAIHLRSGHGYDRPLISEQLYQGHEHLVTYSTWILQKTKLPVMAQTMNIPISKDNLVFNAENILRTKPVSTPYNYVSSSHWKETHYSFSDREHPTRFPPLQFYIDQIKFLYKNLNNAPLFIHIFTDHPNPQILVDKIKKHIDAPNITYSYRKEGNSHDNNILDDLFAMMEFDCLIRPGSSYSKFAQLLGRHKIIIYPTKTTWIEEKKLLVSEVGIVFKAK